jgi:3alpha(or 20beta)-hydroxysteroid dehydrogenase
MSRLTGHTVLVTGGASGIGEATARALRTEDAQVVITDINDTLGHAVADDIGATYEHLDVRNSAQWADVVQRHHFTDGVLNAGAGARFEDLRDVPDEVLETVLDTNLLGVMIGTRELHRSMAGIGGAISVTSSIAGLAAHTQSPVYAASKWGTIGWVRSIATSLAQSGVIINAVCPGLVDTPILGPGGGDAMRRMGLKVLAPAEVAAAHLDSLLHKEPGTVFTVQAEVPVGIHELTSIAGYQG